MGETRPVRKRVHNQTEPEPELSGPFGLRVSNIDPWLARSLTRKNFKIEQATYNDAALEILSDLYEKGVLSKKDLRKYVGARKAIALGMLAAAELCDVDQQGVRIALGGRTLVNRILEYGKDEY